MEKFTLITIYQRVKSETPKFWKKVRLLMGACGAVGGAIVALPEKYTNWMPESIPGMLITAGAIGVALASLTVQDKKEAEKSDQDNN